MSFIALAIVTIGALGYALFGVVRSNPPSADSAPTSVSSSAQVLPELEELGCVDDQ